jgi:fucose 4-O-acetylase-like acetyltransferase
MKPENGKKFPARNNDIYRIHLLKSKNMNAVRKKDTSIETLRGLAIILVVMGHVIGSGSDGGMRVQDDSFLRHLYYTFQYLRMPLFTVISGWVYALRPATLDNLADFNFKKVRRIILPLIFVGGAYYIIQYLVPGTNVKMPLQDIWQIIIFPYTFYWYLNALFLVFIIVSVVDAYKLADTFMGWLVFFVLSLALLFLRDLFIPESLPSYFGFKHAIYLLPFFIIGIGIKRFKAQFDNKIFVWINAVILIAGLIVQQLIWYDIIQYDLSSSGGLGLLIGVSGVIICLRIHFSFRWLVWMGGYAYTIYLFHSFGTSGGRIVLHALGIQHTAPVFFFSLLLGLFLPILIELILDRFGITRMLFLGRSLKRKKTVKS